MMKDAQDWRFSGIEGWRNRIPVFVALETVACNFDPSLIRSMGLPTNLTASDELL